MKACINHHIKTILILLPTTNYKGYRHKVDVLVRDHEGKTARELVEKYVQGKKVQLLHILMEAEREAQKEA